MKVVNFFVSVFSIFAFLTLGSLILIVSMHIISLNDLIMTVQEVYNNFWRSFQAGAVGFIFIFTGLAWAKHLIKRNRPEDGLVYESSMGTIKVSVLAIEDITKKVLRKFSVIKDHKDKIVINDKNLEIKLKLTLWTAVNAQQLIEDVQNELKRRLMKILSIESMVEITAEVIKVVEDKQDEFNIIKNEEDEVLV